VTPPKLWRLGDETGPVQFADFCPTRIQSDPGFLDEVRRHEEIQTRNLDATRPGHTPNPDDPELFKQRLRERQRRAAWSSDPAPPTPTGGRRNARCPGA